VVAIDLPVGGDERYDTAREQFEELGSSRASFVRDSEPALWRTRRTTRGQTEGPGRRSGFFCRVRIVD